MSLEEPRAIADKQKMENLPNPDTKVTISEYRRPQRREVKERFLWLQSTVSFKRRLYYIKLIL